MEDRVPMLLMMARALTKLVTLGPAAATVHLSMGPNDDTIGQFFRLRIRALLRCNAGLPLCSF